MPTRLSEKELTTGGAKTVGQMQRDADEWRDQQPTTSRCAVGGCGWKFSGTAAEARDAFDEHRRADHPDVGKKNPAVPRAEVEKVPAAGPPRRPTVEIRPAAPTDDADAVAEGGAAAVAATAAPAGRKFGRGHRVSREQILEQLRRRAGELGVSPSRNRWMTERWSPSHETIVKNFGGWPEALAAAGLPPAVVVRRSRVAPAAPVTPPAAPAGRRTLSEVVSDLTPAETVAAAGMLDAARARNAFGTLDHESQLRAARFVIELLKATG